VYNQVLHTEYESVVCVSVMIVIGMIGIGSTLFTPGTKLPALMIGTCCHGKEGLERSICRGTYDSFNILDIVSNRVYVVEQPQLLGVNAGTTEDVRRCRPCFVGAKAPSSSGCATKSYLLFCVAGFVHAESAKTSFSKEGHDTVQDLMKSCIILHNKTDRKGSGHRVQ
jgi:hypothetical protein